MKPLKRSDIQNNIDERSYIRGKAYYDEKRVTSLHIDKEDDDVVELSAIVRGSGGSIYRQQIEIEWDNGLASINGTCNCPVAYDCKHVAAACLKYLMEHQISTSGAGPKTNSGACLAWLDEFTAAATSHHKQNPASHELLFYVLKPTHQTGKLQVNFYSAHFLKKGGLSKPRTLSLHNISDSHYPAAYVQPVDQEIGKLLHVNNNNWGMVSLHGELGFLALSKMVQTGRCHWLELETPPLLPGEARELRLHWQEDAKSNAHLKVKIVPEGQLLLTTPPLYLSHETHTVGPLSNAPYSQAQLEKLLHAPAIPATMITEFSRQVARKVPATLLPPPQEVATEEITNERATPCLLLSSREAEGQTYHLLRLRYRYGAHEIAAMPESETTQFEINGKITRIHRNPDSEVAAVDEIAALGFEALIDHNRRDIIFLSMNNLSPMEGVIRWQRFLAEAVPALQQRGWQVEFDSSFHQQVMKGWYIPSRPDEAAGDSTAWYTSFWNFCAAYLNERFDKNWCLSPEQSLLLHTGNRTVPPQLLVHSPRGGNKITLLLHGTSLLDVRYNMPQGEDIETLENMRVFTLPAALIACSSHFFIQNPIDTRTALAMVRDASDVLNRLLQGGRSTIAGRLAGAFRNIGRDRIADDIIKTMTAAGYDIREHDPFETKSTLIFPTRERSPYVNRIRLMWQEMRVPVMEHFPEAPGKVKKASAYLKQVDDGYVIDAYHSLPIEGYRVNPQLIERVRSGHWDPSVNAEDREHRNALAARGYWQAFQSVKNSLTKVLQSENPGTVTDEDHSSWYREMFAPSVSAGLLKPADLAGYRNGPVYIRRSMHVPLNREAVRDTMPVFFDLLREETEPSVRVVLGHFIFVYIHPYMDGNGRMGRFLMNLMLAAGGYPWTIVPVEQQDAYMAALEEASVRQNIAPFAKFLARLVNSELK
jgi:hypothetical protein